VETQLARLRAYDDGRYLFAKFLNGAPLIYFTNERVPHSIGGENGATLVTSYKAIASEAQAKGCSR
jgi:hypothetical protein